MWLYLTGMDWREQCTLRIETVKWSASVWMESVSGRPGRCKDTLIGSAHAPALELIPFTTSTMSRWVKKVILFLYFNVLQSLIVSCVKSSAGSYFCKTLRLPCWHIVSGAYQQQASLYRATRVAASWPRPFWACSGSRALGRRGLASGGGEEGKKVQTEQGREAVQTEQNAKPLCYFTRDQWACPAGSVCLPDHKYRSTDVHYIILAL